MKYSIKNNWAQAIFIFFVIGVLSFGILGILSMNHDLSTAGISPVINAQDSGCGDSHPANLCIEYHLGIMRNFSQITKEGLSIQFLVSFLGLLAVFAAFGLIQNSEKIYSRLRLYFKLSPERSIQAFFIQLGYWLVLFEKRDPFYAFVSA